MDLAAERLCQRRPEQQGVGYQPITEGFLRGNSQVAQAERTAKTVRVTKRKISTAFLLMAGLAGTGVFGQRALLAEKPAADDGGLSARVERRVQAWQPTKEERHLDEIGWAQDIRHALRLAKEHNRPVFLFTYSGSTDRENAMALQRC
jgi:hypothetical protein